MATQLFADAAQALAYRSARPTYPAKLYETLIAFAPWLKGCLAVDVGCGSGQATAELAKICGQVVGIDPSDSQLANAAAAPNILYKQGTAEATGLRTGQYGLLACAQAMHWCDPLRFYEEAARILQPALLAAPDDASKQAPTMSNGRGGVVAVWGYDMASIHPVPSLASDPSELERTRTTHTLKATLYDTTLRAFWDTNRYKLDRHMRDPGLAPHGTAMDAAEAAALGLEPVDGAGIAASAGMAAVGHGAYFQRVARWDSTMDAVWDMQQLEGYLRSWSGYTTYMRANKVTAGSPSDPVHTLLAQVLALYPPGRTRSDICVTMRWRVFMLLAERTDKEYTASS